MGFLPTNNSLDLHNIWLSWTPRHWDMVMTCMQSLEVNSGGGLADCKWIKAHITMLIYWGCYVGKLFMIRVKSGRSYQCCTWLTILLAIFQLFKDVIYIITSITSLLCAVDNDMLSTNKDVVLKMMWYSQWCDTGNDVMVVVMWC